MKTKQSQVSVVVGQSQNMTNVAKKIYFTLIGLSMLCFSGCSVFMPVTIPEIQNYQISILHGANMECPTLVNKPDIQITRMKADAPYDSDNMYYSLERYQLSHYSRNQWVAAPMIMMTKALQEKLLQSCHYSNVVSADFMTTSKYRLNSQLIELQQNMRDGTSTIILAVLVQLVDNKSNKVVKSKTFVEKVDTMPNQHGYIIGVNKTVDKFLDDLLVWLQ